MMQVVPSNYSSGRSYNSGGWTSRNSYRGNYRSRRRGQPIAFRNTLGLLNTASNPTYPKPEVKYSDTIFGTIAAPIPVPSAGITPISLNNIGIGSGALNRVGTQITSKSVFWSLVFNFGTATAPIAIRHIIVWDRQSNGALPAYADLFAQPTLAITSPLNLTNRARFVVIADERITLSPQGDNIRYVSGFRKINQTSTFDVTGVNFPYTGNLVVFIASDEPSTSSTTVPGYYGTWRFRYIDC